MKYRPMLDIDMHQLNYCSEILSIAGFFSNGLCMNCIGDFCHLS